MPLDSFSFIIQSYGRRAGYSKDTTTEQGGGETANPTTVKTLGNLKAVGAYLWVHGSRAAPERPCSWTLGRESSAASGRTWRRRWVPAGAPACAADARQDHIARRTRSTRPTPVPAGSPPLSTDHPHARNSIIIIMSPPPPPIGLGRNALKAVVCLSVPCLSLSRERKDIAGWKLAGRKVTRDPI